MVDYSDAGLFRYFVVQLLGIATAMEGSPESGTNDGERRDSELFPRNLSSLFADSKPHIDKRLAPGIAVARLGAGGVLDLERMQARFPVFWRCCRSADAL